MVERAERRELRGALARGGGAAVVDLLDSGPWPEHCLQSAGDGLRVALGQHVAGAEDFARECVARLRAREWDGDDDLADALEAQLGNGPARLLRPLAVDLEQVAMVLEGDPLQGGGRIDLTSGEVWPQSALEYAADVLPAGTRCVGPRWTHAGPPGVRSSCRPSVSE